MAKRRNGRASLQSIPLFNLPTELFLEIWNLLPPYSRASIILTCRQLYRRYGSSVLDDIGFKTPESRLQRLFFLRLLRRDISSSQFLCHGCLKFHRNPGLDSTKEPQDGHTFINPGFPYCQSVYTHALQEIQPQLDIPSRWGHVHYDSGHYASSGLNMSYNFELHVNRQGLRMKSSYVYTNPMLQREFNTSPLASAFSQFVRSINHEFCEHLWLGEDYAPGDGSLNDRLSKTAGINTTTPVITGTLPIQNLNRVYTGQPEMLRCEWNDICCNICNINVTIHAWPMNRIEIKVGQVYKRKRRELWMRTGRMKSSLQMKRDFRLEMKKKKARGWRASIRRVKFLLFGG